VATWTPASFGVPTNLARHQECRHLTITNIKENQNTMYKHPNCMQTLPYQRNAHILQVLQIHFLGESGVQINQSRQRAKTGYDKTIR